MIHVETYTTLNHTTVRVPDTDLAAFKELVQRAANLWPDAPPEIKHFADVITNGKPMQDYFGNRNLAGKLGGVKIVENKHLPDDIALISTEQGGHQSVMHIQI